MKILFTSLLVVSAAAFGADSSVSDTYSRPSPRLGVEAGMTFSQVSTPSDVSASNRTGLAAGLNFEIPIVYGFSIQPEALFVQRGAELAKVGSANLSVRTNSLEIPVLAKVKIGEDVAPFLAAGPVAIFNLGTSISASDGTSGVAYGYNPRTFDLAFALGAGIDVGPLFATIRYTMGITQLDENVAAWKSRGVHLLGGLRI